MGVCYNDSNYYKNTNFVPKFNIRAQATKRAAAASKQIRLKREDLRFLQSLGLRIKKTLK